MNYFEVMEVIDLYDYLKMITVKAGSSEMWQKIDIQSDQADDEKFFAIQPSSLWDLDKKPKKAGKRKDND